MVRGKNSDKKRRQDLANIDGGDDDSDNELHVFPDRRIERCDESSPYGHIEKFDLVLESAPFSPAYKTFIERCGKALEDKKATPGYIWVALDGDGDITQWHNLETGTFRVWSVADVKYLVKKLLCFAADNPGAKFPEFGVVVHAAVRVECTVLEAGKE